MQASVILTEMFDKVKQDVLFCKYKWTFLDEKNSSFNPKNYQDFIDQETKFLSPDKLHFQ